MNFDVDCMFLINTKYKTIRDNKDLAIRRGILSLLNTQDSIIKNKTTKLHGQNRMLTLLEDLTRQVKNMDIYSKRDISEDEMPQSSYYARVEENDDSRYWGADRKVAWVLEKYKKTSCNLNFFRAHDSIQTSTDETECLDLDEELNRHFAGQFETIETLVRVVDVKKFLERFTMEDLIIFILVETS